MHRGHPQDLEVSAARGPSSGFNALSHSSTSPPGDDGDGDELGIGGGSGLAKHSCVVHRLSQVPLPILCASPTDVRPSLAHYAHSASDTHSHQLLFAPRLDTHNHTFTDNHNGKLIHLGGTLAARFARCVPRNTGLSFMFVQTSAEPMSSRSPMYILYLSKSDTRHA